MFPDISLALMVAIVGLVLWVLFTKFERVADGLIAEAGRIAFFVGLFWVVASGRVL